MSCIDEDDKPSTAGIPPDVVYLFEKLALRLAYEEGFPRFSARAILHQIRWYHQVEQRQHDFKCNNNWTPRLARWFMDQHPELSRFFETRASPSPHDMRGYTGPYEKHES
jgi:hypothetical protein